MLFSTKAMVRMVAIKVHQADLEIVSTLAWLSYATHDATIAACCESLWDNPEMRWWRAFWIFALYCMLLTTQVITFHEKFLTFFGMPTGCIWSDMSSGYHHVHPLSPISLLLMTYGLLNSLFILFPDSLGWIAYLSILFPSSSSYLVG